MTGRTRRILLFLMALIVLGAVIFALYALRGFQGLPLIGGKTEKPVAIETPAPTEKPAETPEVTEEPTPTEQPVTEETPALPAAEPQAEEADFYQKGTLRTRSGSLGFKYETFGAALGGEESDSVSLGHVYSNPGRIRVQFLNGDSSAHQEPVELNYSAENLKQELSTADLDGDGNEELLILLRTDEDEQALLAFALNEKSGEYVQLRIGGREDLAWGSGCDASNGVIWYRHGTNPIQYDCYELQGSELVFTRRLEDDPRSSGKDRFTEYTVAGDSLLKLPEEIDRSKWSFVNFD